MIGTRYLLLLMGASWMFAPTSWACSVFPDYVRPTNFELVQMADAIVVASAQPGAAGSQGGVRFRTRESLKGQGPTEFSLGGRLGKPAPSNPRDLAEPNPEAYAGPCIRWTFASGKSYVIFLVRTDEGEFQQLGYPFTRINEDYFGPDSLWVRTIKTYLGIQQRFSAMEQLAELERLIMTKRSSTNEEDRTLALDMVDHLRSRSPFKPTEYLVATYEELERGETPKFPLRPPSEDREKSVAQQVTDALFGIEVPDELSKAAQMESVLTSLVNGNHPGAAKLFDRLVASEATTPQTFGLALRFFAKNAQFERAFDLIRTRALSWLPLLPATQATQLIDHIGSTMRGDYPEEGKERWRSHPRTAAQWPEMALSLYWYQYYAFGPEHVHAFDDALSSLPLIDYRSRPELTLALAKSYHIDVEKWAIAELSSEEQPLANDAEAPEDPAFLPIQTLVLAYGQERDAAILNVFCQNTNRRALLIRAFGLWADSLDEGLITRMISSPELTDGERDLFGMALAQLHGRETESSRRFGNRGIFDAGGDWYELLKKLLQGKVHAERPVECTKSKAPARVKRR